MKVTRIICISTIIVGIGLFAFASLALPASSPVFPWYVGLASAMFILGLGYLIDSFVLSKTQQKEQRHFRQEDNRIGVKEKAGYLVSKIMSILLCVYLYLLTILHADSIFQLLCIVLVLVQYVLDLSLQIYFARHKNR